MWEWCLAIGPSADEFQPRETEHHADQFSAGKGADDQPSVVGGGQEDVRRQDVGLAFGPDDALQVFDLEHVLGLFKNTDGPLVFGFRHGGVP